MVLLDIEDIGVSVHILEAVGIDFQQFLEPIKTWIKLLIVIKRMGDLVHDKVGVLKKTEHAIVKLNAHIILVLFQAERAEE